MFKTLLTDGTPAMLLYRMMQWATRWRLGLLAMLFNRTNSIFSGCIIGRGAEFGPRFVLIHATGIVINGGVRGGSDVRLEHQVTIGAERRQSPTLETASSWARGLASGSGSGRRRARVGANAVVVHDVPPHTRSSACWRPSSGSAAMADRGELIVRIGLWLSCLYVFAAFLRPQELFLVLRDVPNLMSVLGWLAVSATLLDLLTGARPSLRLPQVACIVLFVLWASFTIFAVFRWLGGAAEVLVALSANAWVFLLAVFHGSELNRLTALRRAAIAALLLTIGFGLRAYYLGPGRAEFVMYERNYETPVQGDAPPRIGPGQSRCTADGKGRCSSGRAKRHERCWRRRGCQRRSGPQPRFDSTGHPPATAARAGVPQ